MSKESIERLIEKRRKRGRELLRSAGLSDEQIQDAEAACPKPPATDQPPDRAEIAQDTKEIEPT